MHHYRRPKKLLGLKQLPVLEYTQNGQRCLKMDPAEIIHFLATVMVEAPSAVAAQRIMKPPLTPSSGRVELHEWLEDLQSLAAYLTLPRLCAVPIKDFATAADKEFFHKQHVSLYDFEQALRESKELCAEMDELLGLLDTEIMESDLAVNGGAVGGMSCDDLDIVPELRNLTVVKAITFPPRVKKYMMHHLRGAGVKTYNDHAV